MYSQIIVIFIILGVFTVLHAVTLALVFSLFKKIKKRTPNAMFVAVFTDVLQSRGWDLNKLKQSFDYLLTYDEQEAETNDIEHYSLVYSKNFDTPLAEEETVDVCFVGHVKNRYNEIIKLQNKFASMGLSTKFYLVGVPKKNRVETPGIEYGNKYLSEEKYFSEYITKSRCLLEIGNPGTDAITARAREAVVYNKKLITNCRAIVDSKYYNPEMMLLYSSEDDIDAAFFQNKKADYRYAGDYEPESLLNKIESLYAKYCHK